MPIARKDHQPVGEHLGVVDVQVAVEGDFLFLFKRSAVVDEQSLAFGDQDVAGGIDDGIRPNPLLTD